MAGLAAHLPVTVLALGSASPFRALALVALYHCVFLLSLLYV